MWNCTKIINKIGQYRSLPAFTSFFTHVTGGLGRKKRGSYFVSKQMEGGLVPPSVAQSSYLLWERSLSPGVLAFRCPWAPSGERYPSLSSSLRWRSSCRAARAPSSTSAYRSRSRIFPISLRSTPSVRQRTPRRAPTSRPSALPLSSLRRVIPPESFSRGPRERVPGAPSLFASRLRSSASISLSSSFLRAQPEDRWAKNRPRRLSMEHSASLRLRIFLAHSI